MNNPMLVKYFDVSMETPVSDLTDTIYNSISDYFIDFINEVFGTVVFDELTESTTRGERYYLGFEGEEYPVFAIGWNTGINSSTERLLYLCWLLDGTIIDNIFNSTNAYESGAFWMCLFVYNPSNNSQKFQGMCYVNTIKSKCVCYRVGQSTLQSLYTSLDKRPKFCLVTDDLDRKILLIRHHGNNGVSDTNDIRILDSRITNSIGDSYTIWSNNDTYNLNKMKRIFADSSKDYISNVNLYFGHKLNGVKICSIGTFTFGDLIKINNEYYLMLSKATDAVNGSSLLFEV